MKRLIALFLTLFIQLPVFAADSGLLVRNGLSGLTPTANSTWVYNQQDGKLYFYDGTNWQQETPGRIQPAGIGPPTSSADSTQGYSIGSLWFDSSGLNWYVCISNAASAAVWNVFTNRVAQSDINNSIQSKSTFADSQADFVVSGLLGTVPGSSLTMTTPTGVAYVSGLRVVTTSSPNTYTASKDTYDYLQTNGSINHVAVTNGASAPTGQTGLALQKVVTSSSVITSVTQLASTASVTNVGTATASTKNAINITQADSRYQLQSTLTGSANQFAATPNGASGAVALRSILSADLPVIGVAQGGTGANLTPTVNSLLAGNGSTFTTVPPPSAGLQYCRSNAGNTALEFAAATGIGTLSIIDGSGLYTYSPNPLTTSGTITGSLATQSSNTFLASSATPGTTAAPTMRKIVQADVPSLAPADTFSDFIVSGFTPPTLPTSTLAMTFSAATTVISQGVRIAILSGDARLTNTYTASKDTYLDIDGTGAFHYTAVTNGAAAPSVFASSTRFVKVVSGASTVTSVTILGNQFPVLFGNFPTGAMMPWWQPATQAVPAGWALCNGASAKWLTGSLAGTTFTTPNMIGMGIQGGDILSGSSAANSFSGYGSSTPQTQVGSGLTGTPGAIQQVASGTGPTVGSNVHTHAFQPPAYVIPWIIKLLYSDGDITVNTKSVMRNGH